MKITGPVTIDSEFHPPDGWDVSTHDWIGDFRRENKNTARPCQFCHSAFVGDRMRPDTCRRCSELCIKPGLVRVCLWPRNFVVALRGGDGATPIAERAKAAFRFANSIVRTMPPPPDAEVVPDSQLSV